MHAFLSVRTSILPSAPVRTGPDARSTFTICSMLIELDILVHCHGVAASLVLQDEGRCAPRREDRLCHA
jgi:hypothetical protein